MFLSNVFVKLSQGPLMSYTYLFIKIIWLYLSRCSLLFNQHLVTIYSVTKIIILQIASQRLKRFSLKLLKTFMCVISAAFVKCTESSSLKIHLANGKQN